MVLLFLILTTVPTNVLRLFSLTTTLLSTCALATFLGFETFLVVDDFETAFFATTGFSETLVSATF